MGVEFSYFFSIDGEEYLMEFNFEEILKSCLEVSKYISL